MKFHALRKVIAVVGLGLLALSSAASATSIQRMPEHPMGEHHLPRHPGDPCGFTGQCEPRPVPRPFPGPRGEPCGIAGCQPLPLPRCRTARGFCEPADNVIY